MGLYVTRMCIPTHQYRYTSNRYLRELNGDALDLQQNINTFTKIESMALVTRDRAPTAETTLQELEDDKQRMEKMRNARRKVLAEKGLVEVVMRNMDYYPSHMGCTRAAFNALQQLVRSPVAMQRMMDNAAQEEKDFDRRSAGVAQTVVTYTKVVRKRGLSNWNNRAKQELQGNNSETQRSDSEHPQASTEDNLYLQACKKAMAFVAESEFSPCMPLRLARALKLFHDDEVIQEYGEDISDAIRGIHEPFMRIERIIRQAEILLSALVPKQNGEDDPYVPLGSDSGGGGKQSWKVPPESNIEDTSTESSIERTAGSKYRVYGARAPAASSATAATASATPAAAAETAGPNEGATEEEDARAARRLRASRAGAGTKRARGGRRQQKKAPFPFAKGNRVEVQLEWWWRRRYTGRVIKAKRHGLSFLYDVKFDDGQVERKIPVRKLFAPSLPVIDVEEALRSVLRIAAYPRWQSRPDLQTRAIRAMKLILDCGDPTANSRLFVMLDGVSVTLAAMKLFPNSARLNIRAAQLVVAVILGPPSRLQGHSAGEGGAKNSESGAIEGELSGYEAMKRSEEKAAKAAAVTANAAKAWAGAGGIKLVCNALRHDFGDAELNRQVRKAGIWALDALAYTRNNVKMMEVEGAMYAIQLCNQDPAIVMTRRLKEIDWKHLRKTRLAGGIDDELQKIQFLKDLFVPCIHAVTGAKCRDPSHCQQCFVNKHATGFWHKIGCREHPGNTNVASLLQMQQLRHDKARHWEKRTAEKEANEAFNQANSYAGEFSVSGLNAGERFIAPDDKNAKHIGRAIPEEWLHD